MIHIVLGLRDFQAAKLSPKSGVLDKCSNHEFDTREMRGPAMQNAMR
jgi:hypothetical protein